MPEHHTFLSGSPPLQAETNQAQIEFFEKSIRPLLHQKCVDCHGEKKQEMGIRFDNASFIKHLKDYPEMVLPDKPENSRLMQVLAYSDEDIQMPPKGKMSDEEIALIRKWMSEGAYWPEEEAASTPKLGGPYDFEALRQDHWAYRPIADPAPPTVQHADRVQTSVDNFILRKLEEQNLSLAPEADKRTLIRRLKFDLLGLPPTWEEVQAFEQNESPHAYAELVDYYLSLPEYGQRWGRHWLDVARYADTKGYVFTAEPRYGYSYTFRDYVIEAFNADKPYDQFLIEQLAADCLELEEPKRELAAMGFLTVGRRFRNNKHDVIDDRIDVVSRGLMGMTVGCARCHDHKYDPIPTEDYYSLYGIFDSCHEPDESILPQIGEPADKAAYEKYLQDFAAIDKELEEFDQKKVAELKHEVRHHMVAYLLKNISGDADVPAEYATSYDKHQLRNPLINRWKDFLINFKDGTSPIWGAWVKFSQLKPEEFEQLSPEQLTQILTESNTNALIVEKLTNRPLKSMYDVALCYGEAFRQVEDAWHTQEDKATGLSEPQHEVLRNELYTEGRPFDLNYDQWKDQIDRAVRNQRNEIVKKQDNLRATSPGSPPRAMVLMDNAKPTEPVVFVRGVAGRRGDKVPRQFFKILEDDNRQPFQNGSGRLELARKIASPDNPLTARVFVNRVWMLHFGNGIVRTPSDFGARSDAPTHPELLDHLATQFIQQGWSIKNLHRLIVNSATYRQSGAANPEAAAVDPENRLLWKKPRQRIEFEAMRDSMLAVAGQLDATHGGKGVDLETSNRRTVYGFINRNNLPTLFRVFDVASPDVSTPQRPQTTVPQQALFTMKSPFVVEQAKQLAHRAVEQGGENPEERVKALYQITYARLPAENEVSAALAFINGTEATDTEFTPWDKLAQVMLMTNEFLFVD
ncbi:MAG: PSD1 and planctomycete cytochrome C domain-containing protein [Planctomycetaceae bacterium]